jgi:predicted DNA-binding transcriptional regulator AlpA
MPRIRDLLGPPRPKKQSTRKKPGIQIKRETNEPIPDSGIPNSAPTICPDDVWLTTREVAQMTKLSEAWFERKRWERAGPPYIKSGRLVRYLQRPFLAWWAEQQIGMGG